MTIQQAARAYCDMSNSCSECPQQSTVQECLVHALAQSKVDPAAVLNFLTRFSTISNVIEGEGSVS